MAQIQKFPKSRLKLNELLAVGMMIESWILSANASVTKFKPQFDNYQVALLQLKESLLKLSKSKWTAAMQRVKTKRNKKRSGLFSQIRSFETHSDDLMVEAAVNLKPFVDKYIKIYKLSFDEQTGRTVKLIETARSDTYKKDIETLKLSSWVDDLETINNECSQCSASRIEEQGVRNIPLKMPESRAAFNVAYDRLVFRLNSLAEIDGDTDYIKLFSLWNELIDNYRVTISLRSGKGKGGKTDGGASSRHDPATGGSGGEEERPGEL